MKIEFSQQIFEKIIKCQVSLKSVGAELLHADRQTGMTKLIFALCNFANPPKKRT